MRPRFTSPDSSDTSLLQRHSDGSPLSPNIPIALIRHLTGATIRDLTDRNPLMLPDHIFFYRQGKLPYTDLSKFYDSIKRYHVVIALQISRGCPVPASWVSVLEETKMKDPDFDFARLADTDDRVSVCNVYFDGVLQDSHPLSHDSQVCLSDDIFRKGVKKIVAAYAPALHSSQEEFDGELISKEILDSNTHQAQEPVSENNSLILELPADLLFFYKRGNLPIADEKVVSTSIQNNYRVICLHIHKGCAVPESWISVLNKLKEENPDFDFVRLTDVECPDSTVGLVLDGVMQIDALQIPHDGTICLNGEKFEEEIRKICNMKIYPATAETPRNPDKVDRILDQWSNQFQS